MNKPLVALENIWTSPCQSTIYRALLQAMSYPGTVQCLAEVLGTSRASLGVLATLVDNATTYSDADHLLSKTEIGLLDSNSRRPAEAAYVLCNGLVPPSREFQPNVGNIYRPEEGSTILLCGTQVGSGGLELLLRGPGIPKPNTQETSTQETAIRGHRSLRLGGFDRAWFQRRESWVGDFPAGVDMILCDSSRVAALPRTTAIDRIVDAGDERCD